MRAYQLATRKASVQRSVNLYLVGMETPSKAQFILQSVPGLDLIDTLPNPIRGMYVAQNRLFVVSGSELYEVYSTGSDTLRGVIAGSGGPVDFAEGLFQLAIVDGISGYALELSTNVLTQITDPGWLGSNRVSLT